MIRRFAYVVVAAALLAAGGPRFSATAPQVLRGPYLQRVSPQEGIVRWRTDVATDSRVLYGLTPGALDLSIETSTVTTEHRVVLSGLAPDTPYYYAVGSTTEILAGGDAGTVLSTSPLSGPVRLWAMGDFGTGSASALAVRDGFLAWNAGARLHGWLALGDNAYTTGTDAEYTDHVFSIYPELLRQVVFWPALGNHDALSSDSATLTGPYYSSFSLPRNGEAGGRPSGTEAYYSFDIGDVHAVALDSADSDLDVGSPMLEWLALDLAETTKPWRVAFFHHPPYSKGSHDSDDPADSEGRMIAVREHVLPILEAAGVDLVLSGHSHAYERSFLLDGHYGFSDTLEPSMVLDSRDGDPAGQGAYFKTPGPHGGTVYVVAGTGGNSALPVASHPAMAVHRSELGSLALSFEGDRVHGWFVRSDGTVGDHFLIVHSAPIFRDGFESGSTAAWSSTGGLPP